MELSRGNFQAIWNYPGYFSVWGKGVLRQKLSLGNFPQEKSFMEKLPQMKLSIETRDLREKFSSEGVVSVMIWKTTRN